MVRRSVQEILGQVEKPAEYGKKGQSDKEEALDNEATEKIIRLFANAPSFTGLKRVVVLILIRNFLGGFCTHAY